MAMNGKLNPKQDAFCREYVVDFNATQAAIRAGYSGKTARQAGQRLLSKVDIAARLAELQSERNERTQISADQTLADLRELADMAMGRKAQPKTIVVEDRAIEVQVRNVSFSGAAKALELLGRHQGLFTDRVDVHHSGVDALLESLAEAASSTPAGRIKARLKDSGSVH